MRSLLFLAGCRFFHSRSEIHVPSDYFAAILLPQLACRPRVGGASYNALAGFRCTILQPASFFPAGVSRRFLALSRRIGLSIHRFQRAKSSAAPSTLRGA